jgi:Ser/Thr protein kinase RdoA (MazF antagonist)
VALPTEAPDPSGVLRAFTLPGRPLDMTPVAGAWSNRMFLLRTDRGNYAVKELRNPWADPGWREWLDAAWDFEQLAYRTGVAMPRPIPNPANGQCLAWVDTQHGETQVSVRVHEWIPATSPGPGPVDAAVAAWAGRAMAALHALDVRPAVREIFPVTSTNTADQWPRLSEEVRVADLPWADLVPAAASAVVTVAALAHEAGDRFSEEVMTHGDIDQKNVLLTPSTPLLCDWDVAAPLLPRRELADVAMSLADWERPDIARAVIAAYRNAGGDDTQVSAQDLGQSLMIHLDWIAFNVNRATGTRAATAAEVVASQSLVTDLLTRLPRHVDTAIRVTTWLEA